METLLSTLKTTIAAGLIYLRAVEVIEAEEFVPEEPGFPLVGLLDGGLVPISRPNQKDQEQLTVGIVAYQAIALDAPGASIMGSETQLGDQGKGLLKIGAELKTLLNDNFLSLNFYWAHLDRHHPTRPLRGEQYAFIAYKRWDYSYRRLA